VTKILYFAWLREKIGAAEDNLALPPDIATVANLIDWLQTRGPGYAAAFEQRKSVRCAVDQEFARPESAIAGAREIAFFPPVTGG
jgi:molybdopterin synthase sulfur carrier subunit